MNRGPLVLTIDDGPPQAVAESRRVPLERGQWARFDLASGGYWYGHGFAQRQPYPLEAEAVVNEAFAVNNAQSPIWMCSAGYAILVRTTAALSVRLNAGESGKLEICCAAEPVAVEVMRERNLPAAVRRLLGELGWPNPAPDKRLLGDCIFCTWTQYPRCITQERVVGMARAVRERGYPCSTLTIDDRWESAFGELEFSRDFPDPRGMVRELHELGFRALLWVTPFVNEEARTFAQLAAERFLVMRKDGRGVARLRWWGGTAGLVDLTRPEAREWYRERLLRLRNDVGVDGFKIDGGDAKYQPAEAESRWHRYCGPSGYADELLAVFEEVAAGLCETRTVWLSQGRHIVWRQGGKDSHWGIDNGLRALVHLALHMAVMGYDVLIPDMVPGRVQTLVSTAPLPTDELMVRWTEASAFLPILQFSYFPWNYGAGTAAACRGLALAHKALEDYLYEQARGRRDPLVRPLWYEAPEVEELYTVGDEFLLGPDLLAAPVLDEGRTERDVLLPPGEWRDAWTGEVFHCGGVLRLTAREAPCPGMPVFVRLANAGLFERVHEALCAIPRGSIRPNVTTATYQAGLDRDLSGSR